MLRDELEQARDTIDFLHNCLTRPEGYRYDYPEQTVESLRRWEDLWPHSPRCVHSKTDKNCPSCKHRIDSFNRRYRMSYYR